MMVFYRLCFESFSLTNILKKRAFLMAIYSAMRANLLLHVGMIKYLKMMALLFCYTQIILQIFSDHLKYLNPNHKHPRSSVVPMEETLSDNKQE